MGPRPVSATDAAPAAAADSLAAPVVTPPPVDAADLDPADELVAERTEFSRTYALNDGRRVTEIYPDPIYYRPERDAGLVAIEPGFSAIAGPDRAAVSDRAPAATTVAPVDDPRGVLAVRIVDGFRVAYRPVRDEGSTDTRLAAAEPGIEGVRADIREVFAGVDLRIFAQNEGAKTFLVLSEPHKVAAWTFAVDLPKGASLRENDASGIDIIDAEGTAGPALQPRARVVPSARSGPGRGEPVRLCREQPSHKGGSGGSRILVRCNPFGRARCGGCRPPRHRSRPEARLGCGGVAPRSGPGNALDHARARVRQYQGSGGHVPRVGVTADRP